MTLATAPVSTVRTSPCCPLVGAGGRGSWKPGFLGSGGGERLWVLEQMGVGAWTPEFCRKGVWLVGYKLGWEPGCLGSVGQEGKVRAESFGGGWVLWLGSQDWEVRAGGLGAWVLQVLEWGKGWEPGHLVSL